MKLPHQMDNQPLILLSYDYPDCIYSKTDYGSERSINIRIELAPDATWPAHIEAFLRFLKRCDYVISDDTVDRVRTACDEALDDLSKDEPDRSIP
jgi:hypothetical protein